MNTNCYRTLPVLLMATGLAACGSGGEDEEDGSDIPVTTTTYAVEFSADQVVSGNTLPDSVTATANLRTDAGFDIAAGGSVTVSGATATAVTINAGYAGETGPVALALESAGGGTWNVPSDTFIDRDELFRLEASGFYVSIETGGGELRGQILPPGWALLMLDLTADAAVPASSATGSAKAGFAFHRARGQIRARITTTGVADAISAGIRNAIAGARGDVAIPLEQSGTDAGVWGSRDVNNVNADDILTSAGFDLFDFGSLYLSVETPAQMDGALRGQLLPDGVETFTTTLTDVEVVTSGPPVDSDGTGTAVITWRASTRQFGIAVNTDLDDAISVVLHQAPAGANGPFVFSLIRDVMVPGNWLIGMTVLSDEQAAALENGELYVTVVTPQFAEGELRGQLTP